MDWVASIHQAIQYIEEHLREELTIREIAERVGYYSASFFIRSFKKAEEITPSEYRRKA